MSYENCEGWNKKRFFLFPFLFLLIKYVVTYRKVDNEKVDDGDDGRLAALTTASGRIGK